LILTELSAECTVDGDTVDGDELLRARANGVTKLTTVANVSIRTTLRSSKELPVVAFLNTTVHGHSGICKSLHILSRRTRPLGDKVWTLRLV
jgi:hypothetical protein